MEGVYRQGGLHVKEQEGEALLEEEKDFAEELKQVKEVENLG